MKLINIKHPEEKVDFREAVLHGLGRRQGLYFFETITPLENAAELLPMESLDRNVEVLGALCGEEVDRGDLRGMIERAFSFPVKCPEISPGIHALELFHGPSLAFKDFGARFMAECLALFRDGGNGSPMTILTATSGDTGAAVAHAYHGQPGIRAVVLYPRGKVTPLQEKLFCTLGGNVTTLAVEADFDQCQRLVKQAFDDPDLRKRLGLNSANSINIARLVAQVCYYFEAAARITRGLPAADREAVVRRLVFSVPSGNFGNLTAGLLARALGLEFSRIIAATNVNDTVPRFLETGAWAPRPTVATLTNAMDISQPNNFPRVLELESRHGLDLGGMLVSRALGDDETRAAMASLHAEGYLADPHSALAWRALTDDLGPGQVGVFLCTAHPAKFREVIKDAIGLAAPLPPALAEVSDKPVLSTVIPGDFEALRAQLLGLADPT